MNFGFPEAWWALGSLAVPFIIHLLSKKKKKIVDFGSLSFLQPSESASSKSLYLSDIWLLLVRSLFITAAIFFMSQFLISEEKVREKRIYVEDSIAHSDAYQSLQEQWNGNGDLEYFTFQSEVDNKDIHTYKSAWSLIAELNKSEDSITVYSHSLNSYFKGTPVLLRKRLQWITVPLTSSVEHTRRDFSQEAISIFLQDPDRDNAKRVKAIIESLTPSLPYELEWLTSNNGAQLEIYIDDAPIMNYEVPTLQFTTASHPLVISQLESKKIKVSGILSREELLHSNLPLIIAGFFNKIVAKSDLDDSRTIEPSYGNQEELVFASTIRKPLKDTWWLLLLPLLLLERYLSYKSVES